MFEIFDAHNIEKNTDNTELIFNAKLRFYLLNRI
jgi:hypothetical protein